MNQKVKEFYDIFVKIEELEDKSEGKFGHYPFSGIAKKDGKAQVFSLCGLRTEQVLGIFTKMINENQEEVFFSLDFPNGGDIMTDFIGVFSYLNKKIEIDLFPYDNKTGNQFEPVKSGIMYDVMCKSIKHITGREVSHG